MKTIRLTLSEDEAEIVVDALDADLEGYRDSIKDARANRQSGEVEAFSEAAARIVEVLRKVRAAIDGQGKQ